MARHTPVSILLSDKAPEYGRNGHIPFLIGFVFCLFLAERNFALHDRIDAILAPGMAVDRIEGEIGAPRRRTVEYAYAFGSTTQTAAINRWLIPGRYVPGPGPATILVTRPDGYSLPETLLPVAPQIRKQALWRGRLGVVMSVVMVLGAGIARMMFERRQR